MIQNFLLIFNNLPPLFKKKSIIFVFFLLSTTALELFGIGLIIPILDLLTNSKSNILDEINSLEKYVDTSDTLNLLIFILSALIAIYIIKSLILIYFYYWTQKFIWDAYKKISNHILSNYIGKNLDFYFGINSTELINNSYLESRNYVSCLSNYLQIISEATILFAILIFLLIFDFTSTIVIGCVILISSLLITYFTKRKVKELGEKRIQASIGQLKNLRQIFYSIKDIKLKSLENNFLSKYNNIISNFSRSAYLFGTINELPKIFFEIIFLISISLIIYILEVNSISEGNTITKIGIYAVAAFRSFPSVYRIIKSFQTINFLSPSIKKVLPNLNYNEEKNFLKENNVKKIIFNRVLKIDNISYTYPNKKNPVIKNFSLEVKKGDFIGIVGESGKGKSTLLDIIMGFLKPSSGSILVDGVNLKDNTLAWQKSIGYVSQLTHLLDESIKNNIAFGIPEEQIDNKKLEDAAKKAQIYNFISSLKSEFDTQVGERGINLSGGQIQRIGIARELYRDPDILLLDEATSSLDIEKQNEFMKCLNDLRGKKTIIFVSHRESALKDCDKVINLNEK